LHKSFFIAKLLSSSSFKFSSLLWIWKFTTVATAPSKCSLFAEKQFSRVKDKVSSSILHSEYSLQDYLRGCSSKKKNVKKKEMAVSGFELGISVSTQWLFTIRPYREILMLKSREIFVYPRATLFYVLVVRMIRFCAKFD